MSIVLALLLLIPATQEETPGLAPDEYVAAATQPNGPGLWIGGVAFAREDIAAAEQQFDPSTGWPMVVLTFSETGRRKFAEAQQGRVSDILEIALDGELIATPFLMEPITGAEIMIAGSFTLEEAVRLAERLRGLPPPR